MYYPSRPATCGNSYQDMEEDEDDVVVYRPSISRARSVANQPVKKQRPIPAASRNNNRKQQELLERQTKAASLIQKAFRKYLIAKKAAAVRVISQAYLRYRGKLLVRETVIGPLKTLRELQSNVSQLQEVYLTRRRVLEKPIEFESNSDRLKHVKNRDLLEFEDSLMRLTLKVDSIQSGGCEYLRTARKSLVKTIQILLDAIDSFKSDKISRRRQELAAEMSIDDSSSSCSDE